MTLDEPTINGYLKKYGPILPPNLKPATRPDLPTATGVLLWCGVVAAVLVILFAVFA